MTTSLRSLRSAAALRVLFAVAPRPDASAPHDSSARRRPTRPHARRRRPSSATPGSGSCRPPKSSPDGKWSASGYRRGTNYDPGLHQRRRLRRHVRRTASRIAPRSSARSWSTRASIATSGRSSSTTRRSAASSIAIRASTQTWTGDNVGDFYLGAKVNLWSECRQKPAALAVRGIVKLPTGDDGRRRQHGQGRLSSSTSSSARKLAKRVEVSGLRRLRVPRQPGRLRHAERRVPLGRRRRRSRRAARCACTAELNGVDAVERRTPRSPAAPIVGVDGSARAVHRPTRENITRATRRRSPSRRRRGSSSAPA